MTADNVELSAVIMDEATMSNKERGRSIPGIHRYGIPVLRIQAGPAEYADALREIDRLYAESERLRAEADRLRAATTGVDKQPADAIISAYYEARQTSKRLTLRQYLKDIGIPGRESYIRKRKVLFDKAKRRKPRGRNT